jgi:hypothetical protein
MAKDNNGNEVKLFNGQTRFIFKWAIIILAAGAAWGGLVFSVNNKADKGEVDVLKECVRNMEKKIDSIYDHIIMKEQ